MLLLPGHCLPVYVERAVMGSDSTLVTCLQSEIADMIWEVDEDCDHAVNWHEFQSLYRRCTDDQAGLPKFMARPFLLTCIARLWQAAWSARHMIQ